MEKGSIRSIYCRMQQNDALAGHFELADGEIRWDLFPGYNVIISEDLDYCIAIEYRLFGKLPDEITHWHPEADAIDSEICKLGTKGYVTVLRKSIWGTAVLYQGPKELCPYHRKWLLGRYLYLCAE